MSCQPKLYIDFDGCIANSIKQIVKLYNKDFRLYKGYKTVDWTDINSWDFLECNLASKGIINDYFEQYRFFDDGLEFMDNAQEVITELSKDYYIVICTMGYEKNNLKYKKEWINKYLPCVNQFIGVDMNTYKDKSHIDMSDAFAFVDDCSNNLESSNCNNKILFGDEYSWNLGWNGVRCYNWYDVKRYLKKIQ